MKDVDEVKVEVAAERTENIPFADFTVYKWTDNEDEVVAVLTVNPGGLYLRVYKNDETRIWQVDFEDLFNPIIEFETPLEVRES